MGRLNTACGADVWARAGIATVTPPVRVVATTPARMARRAGMAELQTSLSTLSSTAGLGNLPGNGVVGRSRDGEGADPPPAARLGAGRRTPRRRRLHRSG